MVDTGEGGGQVWVLGAGSGSRDRRQWWSRRYSVQVVGVEQRLAWPHFAHGGHALTMDSKSCVFTHRMRAAGALQCGEVQSVGISEEGQVASMAAPSEGCSPMSRPRIP
jgi:hypothetical protein